jgi:hypothetical protein
MRRSSPGAFENPYGRIRAHDGAGSTTGTFAIHCHYFIAMTVETAGSPQNIHRADLHTEAATLAPFFQKYNS